MVAQPAHRLFTVDEYYRMVKAGILGEDDRVELIKGEIVEMSPIGSLHAACTTRLNQLLQVVSAMNAIVSVQNPLRLNSRSEPVPDLMLLSRRADFYATGHPGPGDVRLLIEVSDTSFAYDSGIRLRLYVRSGIPEVWIVDLQTQRVLTYRDPAGSSYRQSEVVERGAYLTPSSFPDVHIAVADVLG